MYWFSVGWYGRLVVLREPISPVSDLRWSISQPGGNKPLKRTKHKNYTSLISANQIWVWIMQRNPCRRWATVKYLSSMYKLSMVLPKRGQLVKSSCSRLELLCRRDFPWCFAAISFWIKLWFAFYRNTFNWRGISVPILSCIFDSMLQVEVKGEYESATATWNSTVWLFIKRHIAAPILLHIWPFSSSRVHIKYTGVFASLSVLTFSWYASHKYHGRTQSSLISPVAEKFWLNQGQKETY